jgi:hypothetical protein
LRTVNLPIPDFETTCTRPKSEHHFAIINTGSDVIAMTTCCLSHLPRAVLIAAMLWHAASRGFAADPNVERPSALTPFDGSSTDSDEITAQPRSAGLISTSDGYSNWLKGVNGMSSPKTLMSWNGAETDDAEPDPKLVTDRPHFSEASSLVGLGRVQIETGYTFTSDRSNGIRTITQSFGEPLLRAGIGAEWFEFRIATTALTESVSAGNSRFTSGVDDIYIGAKVAITEQAGALPEFAIFPQARLPTGSSAFSSDRFLPGVNLAYSWKLNDWLELECNTQFNSRRDDLAHTYTEAIQTANMEYELAENLGAFTELIGFFPTGSLSAVPEYYFHAGFVYFVTNDIQVDIHSGAGLNSAATNLAFTGAGFSWRY